MALAANIGSAQLQAPQATARRIRSNAEQVRISLRLDRDTYFPGERVLVTVSLQNGTAGPLEIPDPFALRSAALDIFAPHPNYRGLYPDSIGPTNPYPRRDQLLISDLRVPATITLAAGQELSRTFDSSETFPGDRGPVLSGGAAPRYTGPYRVVYSIANPTIADFRVIPAVLEAFALVPLTGTFQVAGKRDYRDFSKIPPPVIHPRGTFVAALGGDGAHWVVASRSDKNRAQLLYYFKKEELNSDNAASLYSHVRVAQSTLPITSISGLSAPDDTITITWTDSSGKTDSIRVDKDRRVLPAQK